MRARPASGRCSRACFGRAATTSGTWTWWWRHRARRCRMDLQLCRDRRVPRSAGRKVRFRGMSLFELEGGPSRRTANISTRARRCSSWASRRSPSRRSSPSASEVGEVSGRANEQDRVGAPCTVGRGRAGMSGDDRSGSSSPPSAVGRDVGSLDRPRLGRPRPRVDPAAAPHRRRLRGPRGGGGPLHCSLPQLRHVEPAPPAAGRALRRPAQGVPARLRRAERHRGRGGITGPDLSKVYAARLIQELGAPRAGAARGSPTGSTPPTSTGVDCSTCPWTS